MKPQRAFRQIPLAACLSVLLAACGGGGGGADPTMGAGTPAPTPASPPAVVSEVPAPTYASESAELKAYRLLNAERGRCGFGLLAQNASLDRSAAAHSAYLVANQATGHGEDPGKPGFTGQGVGARAAAAGYAGATGEYVVSAGGASPTFGDAATQMGSIMAAPYHAGAVLVGYRDVGFSWVAGAFVVNLGIPAGTTAQAASGLRTFPCEGSTDVAYRVQNEVPSPFPSEAGATWGPTINVIGTRVRISAASVTGPEGSVAIKAIYADGQQRDPEGDCTGSRACVIPVVLRPATTYQVHVEGTQDGVAFRKDFSFKTRS